MLETRHDELRMRQRALAGGTLAVVAVIFVSLVVLSGTLLRGARLDLTQNRLYTLSEGTRNIVRGLEEPVHLHFFFSEHAAGDYPAIRAYAGRVRELVEEIAAHSAGMVRVEVIDPRPFSEAEDRATSFGLQPVPVGTGGSLFFGLAGSGATGEDAAIPFFQPDKEAFLEYDLAKLIVSVAEPVRPVVGVISNLPMGPAFDPGTGEARQGWVIDGELRQLFDLRRVERDVDAFDADMDLLLIAQPGVLGEDTLYAIDQFVLGGGRVVAFLDPFAESMPPPLGLELDVGSQASTLPGLLQAWGIEFDPGRVVLDAVTALQVQGDDGGPPVRHLALLGLGREHLNSGDIVTADLDAVNLATSGHFEAAAGTDVSIEPLLQSSSSAATVDVTRLHALEDPDTLFDDFEPANRRYVLAARLSGRAASAFPERTAQPGHLGYSIDGIQVILVADTDLLSDRLWVQTRTFGGQRISSAFANNGDFVVNAVDNLLGSDDLISVRTRPGSARPFVVVERLRRLAEDRYRAKERELQAELLDTERRLAALQAEDREAAVRLTPSQESEIERFRAEQLRIRRELREVRFELNAEIDALGARLRLLNILAVPFIVTVIALLFAVLRERSRRERMERPG